MNTAQLILIAVLNYLLNVVFENILIMKIFSSLSPDPSNGVKLEQKLGLIPVTSQRIFFTDAV